MEHKWKDTGGNTGSGSVVFKGGSCGAGLSACSSTEVPAAGDVAHTVSTHQDLVRRRRALRAIIRRGTVTGRATGITEQFLYYDVLQAPGVRGSARSNL